MGFVDLLKDASEDSKKDREPFGGEHYSMMWAAAQVITLIMMIAISWLPFVTFEQVGLFFILGELTVIKDTMRKSLTPVR